MDFAIFVPLIQNAAFLLGLSVIFEIAYGILFRYRRVQLIASGVFISLICIAIMALPYTLQPGLVFDTRSILISVTALIFGPVPTVITVMAALLYRLSAGGIGTLPGVLVIVSCALIGLGWRRWLYPRDKSRRWFSVYLMSMAVHLVMLLCMLPLPYPGNVETIRVIALPVLLIYPVTAALLSLLLMRQQDTKKLQEQLSLSEERFRILFEQAPLGYQSLDSNGRFLEVNQQWLDMFGYTRGEVIGEWFGDFLSPDCVEEHRRQFAAFKATGHTQNELVMISKTKEPMHISFVGKIRYDDQGRPARTHCILQDITSHKAALAELRSSEEKHRRLYETMSQGVVYQSANGEITSANPAAERVLGISFDQMRGKTSTDPRWQTIREDGTKVSGNDHPSMVALRTGKPCGPMVLGVFRPEISDHVWLSITATPLFRPGEKQPYQAYALFEDITARRKAQQNYRTLFNEMMDAFAVHEILCDERGKPVDYRFLAVNPAFETMTGLKAKDIIGKTVLEVIPTLEDFWIDTYGKVALTGEPVQFENFNRGTNRHFAVSAYRSGPNQFACTFINITQRVQAEQEARENSQRLRGLLDNSPGPMMIVDQNGFCVSVSSSMKAMMGWKDDREQAAPVFGLLPVPIAEKIARAETLVREDDRVLEAIDVFEVDGEKRYFESRFFPIPAEEQRGKLYGYIGIDITQRVLAEQALQASEERYASYIKNAPSGIVIIDETGQLIEANDAAIRLAGYPREEFIRPNIMSMVDPDYLEDGKRLLGELLRRDETGGELRYKHRDGSARWAAISAVKLAANRFLCFISDITEQKTATEKLIYINNHDYMTGLWNRRHFEAETEWLNTPEQLPLSVIIGDINGLKLINDSFGRMEGDRIIVETAGFLKAFCRPGDVLARTGGDEFTLLLPKTDGKAVERLIADIQLGCGEYNKKIADDSLHINLALGGATKSTADESFLAVIKHAENSVTQRKLLESKSLHSSIIATIKATMMEKSHETEAHEERMAEMARKVGVSIGLSEVDLNHIELLAELHDIGKVGISEQVLNKPGKLTPDEWEEMKKHPEIGERIALSVSSLAPIANYILCHHERWDGTGYPNGLKEGEIPLLSRILAVVDAYDAMTQDRVYQKARGHEEAMEQIMRGSGTQFDPQIARIFCEEVFRG